jgi:hypothetical protein
MSLSKIKKWEALAQETESAYQDLRNLFGADCDAKIPAVLFNLLDKYTKELASNLGDESGLLFWYLYDNFLGKRGLTWNGRRITNVNQLCRAMRRQSRK